MNLKPRDRSEVYDQLYRLAQRILSRGNACRTCPIKRHEATKEQRCRSWCCDGCPNLGEHGCTVQALGCSLWLCGSDDSRQYSRGKLSTMAKRLQKLQRIASHYEVHVARASKEESLQYGPLKDFWCVYHGRHGSRKSGNTSFTNYYRVR